MTSPSELHGSPNALAQFYSRFRVAERLRLTGHSHQAWPDCARIGQLAAFDDAARSADDKWERAFAVADRVRRGIASMLGDETGSIALAASTHELLIRFLSSLPLDARPRLVTTDGEFHTIRRQFDRLAEAGIEIVKVNAHPADTVVERLAAQVNDRTAAAFVSSVFFGSGQRASGLDRFFAACRHVGAECVVDSYHALGVVPTDLPSEGLDEAWVLGGGYKYLQMGEGNCFLRVPPKRRPRPVITGWYAEFETLADEKDDQVPYGPGAAAFGGATYDPTSHYRAAAVLDFWQERGLTPELLRQVSQHQVGLLIERFDALDLPEDLVRRDRAVPLDRLGGFLALESPRAGEFQTALASRGVATDHRGTVLRLGPAPYLSDQQLEDAMGLFGEAARELA